MYFGTPPSKANGHKPDGVTGKMAKIRRSPHFSPLPEEDLNPLPRRGTFLERMRQYYTQKNRKVVLYEFSNTVIGVRDNGNGLNEVVFDLAAWRVKNKTDGPKYGIGCYTNLCSGGMSDIYESAKSRIVPRSRSQRWHDTYMRVGQID